METPMKRILITYIKVVLLSTVGMIAAHGVLESVPGIRQYEEYIVATSIAFGTVLGLRWDGIRIFSWTLFYLSYEILLVISSVIRGTASGLSAGMIFVRFLFGTVMMALVLLGVRLYVIKNIAIQIGRLKFGCFDDIPPELLCDEDTRGKKKDEKGDGI